MADAAKAAEQANSGEAAGKAREALEKMEALLRKKNGICQMCRGEGEEPFPWPEDLSSTMLAQTFQSTACNAIHSIEQRTAKWIISAMERTDGEEVVPLTHARSRSIAW